MLSLDLSNNCIKNINDMKIFVNLKILNISYNTIDDISSLEYLEQLDILNAQHNLITSISSLNKCRRLTILGLSDNKINYQMSTLKTFQNLKELKEITINNNLVIYRTIKNSF